METQGVPSTIGIKFRTLIRECKKENDNTFDDGGLSLW